MIAKMAGSVNIQLEKEGQIFPVREGRFSNVRELCFFVSDVDKRRYKP